MCGKRLFIEVVPRPISVVFRITPRQQAVDSGPHAAVAVPSRDERTKANFDRLIQNVRANWRRVVVQCADGFNQLIEKLLEDAGIKPLVKPPKGVEVSIRQGNGQKLLFVINHTEEPQTVNVPKGKLELLTNKKTKDTITLGTFDVAVIKL